MKTYLAGSIESSPDGGITWRKELKEKFKRINIDAVIPNDANGKTFLQMKQLKFENIEKYINEMRGFIKTDIKLIDECDFITCYWNGEVSTGTVSEIFYSHQNNKPCFLITELELQDIPGWFLSCFTKVFSNFNQIIKYMENRTIFIVDIDGTISNSIPRIKKICNDMGIKFPCNLDKTWTKELMKEFLDNSLMDPVIDGSHKLFPLAYKSGAEIVFLTGRNEVGREKTRQWLVDVFNASKENPLLMRPASMEKERSDLCKEKVFVDLVYNIRPSATYIFFEDCEKTAKLYSKYGVVLKAPQCWDTIRI
jgi:hypothetical protein